MESLCTACLCSGRNLYYLTTESDCYRIYNDILNEVPVYKIEWSRRVCWQCRSLLLKFSHFRRTVQQACSTLLDLLQQATPDIDSVVKSPHLRTKHFAAISYPEVAVKEESQPTDLIYDIKLEPSCSQETETHTEPVAFVNNLDLTETSRKPKRETAKRKVRKKVKEKVDLVAEKSDTSDDNEPIARKVKAKTKRATKKPAKKKKERITEIEDNIVSDNEAVDIVAEGLGDESNGASDFEEVEKEPDIVEDMKEVTLTHEEMMKERAEDAKSDKFLRNQFKCNSCIVGFRDYLSLKSHNDSCHNESIGSHVCATCRTRTSTAAALALHGGAHYRRYVCARCPRREREAAALRAHLDTHEKEARRYRCRDCQHCSESLAAHQTHMSKAHNEKPQCVECGKLFSSRKTYRYHLNVLHKGQNRFPCPHCGKVYQWKSNLWRHIKNHKARDSGELYCQPCDKRFASIATYRQHIKISRQHVTENEFSFVCSECGKKFVSKSKLKDHVDWEHLHQINYRCQLCHKPFKSATSLYVHLQNVHRNKDEKDNLCHVCGKSYQSTAKLKYHIVAMHTGQTPYSCGKCGAAFSWYSSLYRHSREVHDKIKVKKSKKCKKSPEEYPAPPVPVPLPLPLPPLHPLQ